MRIRTTRAVSVQDTHRGESVNSRRPHRETRGARYGTTTILVALAYILAVAAVIAAGLLADLIPSWGWPLLALAILLGGMALLARDGDR